MKRGILARAGRFTALAAASVLVLAGCGGGGGGKADSANSSASESVSPAWQQVIDAANKEGTVDWYYVVPPDTANNVIQAFQAKYPNIKVQGVRVLSDIKSKLDAEQSTGSAGADVVSHSQQDLVPTYRSQGQLVDIGAPSLGAWQGSSQLLGKDAVVSSYTVLGLAWNTDQVSSPVKSYNDLLDPKYGNGKIGIVKPNTQGTADYYSFFINHFGADFLQKLAAQKPRVYDTLVPMQQALESGEIAVASYASPAILTDKQKGAPVDYLQPKPSWGAPIDTFIVKWTKHPNAAQVFTDFMLSKQGQEAYGKNQSPALKGVPGIVTVDQVDPVVTPLDHQNEVIAEWGKTFGR